MPDLWKKLIIALDLEEADRIKKAVRVFGPRGVKFKIGSIAFTRFGPALVKSLAAKGRDIFLDLKLYDIPNTMARTAGIITTLGCWAFTVHIQAGPEALKAVRRRVRETAKKLKVRRPLILGVSELTSRKTSRSKVLALAAVAAKAKLDGVVASAWEAGPIKRKYRLKVITAGIRPEGEKSDDQKRVATARFALKQGADYLVVGRPIISRPNWLQAAELTLFK